MKKLLYIFVILPVLFVFHIVWAEKTDTIPQAHNYAFYLSCGITKYYTSLVELSSERLLEIEADYEREYCGVIL